jgi:hypothetical protein
MRPRNAVKLAPSVPISMPTQPSSTSETRMAAHPCITRFGAGCMTSSLCCWIAAQTSTQSRGGFLGTEVQPIDVAIWGGNPLAPSPGDFKTARILLNRGAVDDLTVAAAFGDLDRVRAMLDQDPALIRIMRRNGRRPLNGATEFGKTAMVRLLLERGADPRLPHRGRIRPAARPGIPLRGHETWLIRMTRPARPGVRTPASGTPGWRRATTGSTS